MSKALDISNATARVAPNLLKAPRRSAVDREDLKPDWKSEKRPHFFRWSTILLFTKFLKALLTIEKRLTGRCGRILWVFECWRLKGKSLNPKYFWRLTTSWVTHFIRIFGLTFGLVKILKRLLVLWPIVVAVELYHQVLDLNFNSRKMDV